MTNPLTAMLAPTDEQAMWRIQAGGDDRAFGLLVTRWQAPVRRLCFRMTGDAHLAEDLAQEAFARVYARRLDFQAGSRFSTWLWRIATNLCIDELRRGRRRRCEPLENGTDDNATLALADPGMPPDASLDALDRSERVRTALLRLSEAYRCVVVLKHYEGLKFREIAAILEIPEGTAKSRMAEALRQLAPLLRPLACGATPIESRNPSPPFP